MGNLRIGTIYPPSIKLASTNVSKVMYGLEQVWPEQTYKSCTVIISGFNYRTAEGEIYARVTMDTNGTKNIEYVKGYGYLDCTVYGPSAFYIRIGDMPYENVDIYEIRESSEGVITKDPWQLGFVCDLAKCDEESNTATIDFGNLGRPTKQIDFKLHAKGVDGTTIKEEFAVIGTLYNNGEVHIKELIGPEGTFTWSVYGTTAFLRLNYAFEGEYKYTKRDVYDTGRIFQNVSEENNTVSIPLNWIQESSYDYTKECVIWEYTYVDDKCYVNIDENYYMASGYKWGAKYRLTVHKDGRVDGRIDQDPQVVNGKDYITLTWAPPQPYTVDSYGGAAVTGITMPSAYKVMIDKSLINGQTFNGQRTAHES